MRVAFDQQVFLLQEYGGISRYVCSLAVQLNKIHGVEAKIVSPLHYNACLGSLPKQSAWGVRVPRVPKTFRIVEFVSRHAAHIAASMYAPDIYHETYYSTDDYRPGRAKRIVTVYDMIYERFPSQFAGGQLTEAKKAAVSRADHVLCISENTRRDLIEIFKVPSDRISVVYLGYDELPAPATVNGSTVSLSGSRPYLLYVGSRGGYKNFDSLLQAFASSAYLKADCSLYCFGGGAFSKEELDFIQELKLSNEHIRQFNGDDETLALLYKNAAAFVYPSRYEGFGIPPLEAMSLDCPVISSNTSSIPEVVGDAGEYFDPDNHESMRVAIESVLESPARRHDLVMKGRARRAEFSWARCARETLTIYRSLL